MSATSYREQKISDLLNKSKSKLYSLSYEMTVKANLDEDYDEEFCLAKKLLYTIEAIDSGAGLTLEDKLEMLEVMNIKADLSEIPVVEYQTFTMNIQSSSSSSSSVSTADDITVKVLVSDFGTDRVLLQRAIDDMYVRIHALDIIDAGKLS